MEKIIGIYKIVNKINSKIYVGQSIDIYDRWQQHRYKANNPKEKGFNQLIHQAMRKYGDDNFTFEIIEQCSQNLLDEREKFWIAKLNTLAPNGYNILQGGQQNREAHIWTCEICGCRISKGAKRCIKHTQAPTNRPEPLELARIIREQGGFEQAGRYFGVSGNAIRKWCKTFNIPHTTKEIISWYETQIGYTKPNIPNTSQKRPVAQIDIKTNQVITIFESAAAAARALGKSKGSHITECCHGKLKTAYGFKWTFI